MNKLMFLAFAFILLSGFASASEYVYATQATTTNIYIPCINNGASCSASATCNLTIWKLDGTYLINNQIMTNNNNGDFNYTVEGINITSTGDYSMKMVCADGSTSGSSTPVLRVTPTGDSRGISWILILYIMAAVIFILALYMRNAYFSIIAGLLIATGGVYTMSYGFNNTADIWTQMISIVAIGIGLYLLLVSSWELVSDDEGDDNFGDDDEE